MTNLQLKILAFTLMTVDHVGAILFPQMIILRIIGRMAFPIFAFLLVEGFRHTRNMKRYLIRLGFFALISEPVFDLCFNGRVSILNRSNILFTLFYGLILLLVIDLYRNKKLPFLQTFVGTVACVFMVVGMDADYGLYGLLMILGLYMAKSFKTQVIALAALNAGYVLILLVGGYTTVQVWSILALLPIAFYNGKLGKKLKQFNMYMYYPVHLLLLFVISRVMS